MLSFFSSMVTSFFRPALLVSKMRLAEAREDNLMEMVFNETIPLECRKFMLSSFVKENERDKERAEKENEIVDMLLESKNENIAILRMQLVDSKANMFALQSKYAVVVATRPLIETWCGMLHPTLSSTSAVNTVSQSLVSNGKLTDEALQWLKQLEGTKKNEADIARELTDLFHELSKMHHHLQTSATGFGFVCGGPMPLRAAVALTILTLQKTLQEYTPFNVRYTDQDYQDKYLLCRGKVKPKQEF